MAEQPKEQKKSVWFKLQEAVPDREEQFEFVSLAVRLILLVWATAMLSLSYLDLSKLGIPPQLVRIDTPIKLIVDPDNTRK